MKTGTAEGKIREDDESGQIEERQDSGNCLNEEWCSGVRPYLDEC